MHLIEEHYYTINKSFLKMLGIWPHNKSRFILLQRILITFVTVTYISMQWSIFITAECTMPLFVKTMIRSYPFAIIVMKYFIFMFKSEAIKNMHYQIQQDWKLLRNKLESKIIQQYAHEGQLCTLFIFSFISFILVLVTVIQFLPNILDVILPLDEPRPRRLLVTAEYFIVKTNDKYYYTRVFHELVFLTMCASMIFATATQLLTFAFHSFGMFKIASHRIKYSIEESILHVQKFGKEYTMCKTIMHAVTAHRRAMEFSNIFISCFNAPYCVMAILGIISLSISLYGLIEAATISKSMENLVICFISVIGHLVYIFVASYVGQKIIDYNNDLFKLAYNTSWYLMPVSSQKLILFLMQKTSRDFYFMIGLIFVAKMESSTTLMNAALSYVAVMYSCVQK
ncbi:hypothetical protein DMN91_010359 [Ooceraea biroi]|uniref:Odorant receptor n=1 Tax=Ooceraea biroi TaxID=2015173 RepID=A0A026VWW5_OOCBI|nr:uncharacterized protein LOC105285741 isoform X2 [Ooceraea biroi]EZA48247.1 hypothetical protein X777_14146 [Ooceraea biroi]RLU18116.1 hypothetical protein DMN91_010359 [Ooceraea biroi]